MSKPGDTAPAIPRACPLCGKPASLPYKPFCSRRCADIDLGRWLNESYRIPDTDTPPGNPERDDE